MVIQLFPNDTIGKTDKIAFTRLVFAGDVLVKTWRVHGTCR
jgi:hypothetical protein